MSFEVVGGLVRISVQGSMFELNRLDIENYDWLLKTILSSEIPTQHTNEGLIYLDVDPTSFRILYNLLRSPLDIDRLKRMQDSNEWELLKSTADYLGLIALVEVFAEIDQTKMTAITEIKASYEIKEAEYEREIIELKARCKVLTDQLIGVKMLDSALVQTAYCSKYRTYRSGNRCGNRFIVIGNLGEDFSLRCHCDNLSDEGTFAHNIKNVSTLDDLNSVILNITSGAESNRKPWCVV